MVSNKVSETEFSYPPFSVVMATYQGDDPAELREAVESVLFQTTPPIELLIVIDGPIGEALREVLMLLSANHSNVVTIECDINRGPGAARHTGILSARSEIVGIMDADDICRKDRFEKQLPLICSGKADIVGAWILEFDPMRDDWRYIRRVPENHNEILEMAQTRSPMNNVSIVFRKSAYMNAGGFREMRSFEDYDLFVRMLQNGCTFYNVQEILVDVRSGEQMFLRRGGLWQVAIETKMLVRFYKSGFMSAREFVVNLIARGGVRLMPNFVRRMIYLSILRKPMR